MTAVAEPITAPSPIASPPEAGLMPADADGPQRFVFGGVDWAFYQDVSRRLSDRPGVFVTYWKGRLEVVTTSMLHEIISALLVVIVSVLAEETDTSIKPAGRATLTREDLEAGVEPDASFYVANQPRMRGREEIRLPEDPPPDLAIEVEVTRRLGDRRTIYQELGVAEIWVYGVTDGLAVLLKQTDGTYVGTDRSPTFPLFSSAELTAVVREHLPLDDQTASTKAFRRRVREALGRQP